MAWRFELVAGPFGGIAEGPVWDGSFVYFTLIQQNRIMRYDPRSGECTEWRTGTRRTNGAALDPNGVLYGCSAGGRSVVRFDAGGGTTVIVDKLDGKRLNTPSDLVFDRRGRLWFSNPWNKVLTEPGDEMELADQCVCRVERGTDGAWSVARATFDSLQPNGLAISPDQTILYVAESSYHEHEVRELRAYPIQDDGSLGTHIVLHEFGKDHRGVHRGIDGMRVDTDGNIIATAGWQKSGPGPMLYVFAPSGRVLKTHPFPGDRPTNCTFAGADMRTLYVTTVEGHLFRADTGHRGFQLQS